MVEGGEPSSDLASLGHLPPEGEGFKWILLRC